MSGEIVARWSALCVLVALCLGGPPAMAGVAVPGDASATASAAAVDPGHGCADTLVTYAVSLPPEATTWILTVRGTPEGGSSSFFHADSASGDPLSGQGSMEVCGEGGPEVRTLTWQVDWTYVDQGERIHASDSGTSGTFVVNGTVPPSPFACPECDHTTTLGLRVARKGDRSWVLRSTLVWRKGPDSARIADAGIALAGPRGSGFRVLVARTNARGVATFRVRVPRRPVRLHTSFTSGKATWGTTTIYLPRARSASVRVG